jgi:putative ABC transport system permease protein
LLAAGSTLAALERRLPARLGSGGGLILLLLGCLLAIPLLTAILGRFAQWFARRFLPVGGLLAADNLLRAPRRTGLTIAALTAGVALLLQTAGLIRSNEDAVLHWVDHSIAGNLFVTCGGPMTASGRTLPMAEDLVRQLRQLVPEARFVGMRFRYLDWQRGGRPTRVLLVAMDAAAYASANETRQPPLPEQHLYRQLDQPGTALVSDNFAVLHDVHPGETITLPGLDGPVTLRVLGTFADYSCSRGAIAVDRQQYGRQFDAALADGMDVYLPPDSDPERVRQVILRSPTAAERGLCVLNRAELRDHILGMVHRLYGLAYGQEVVVALVALLGMVSALLISVLQRQRELGLLRAIGATRSQVLRSVLAEALFMGGIGTVLGFLFGWPLEWYTVRVLQFAEAGFRCPVHFPSGIAAGIAGLALACAAVAGLGPALFAVRPTIARAIAHE